MIMDSGYYYPFFFFYCDFNDPSTVFPQAALEPHEMPIENVGAWTTCHKGLTISIFKILSGNSVML